MVALPLTAHAQETAESLGRDWRTWSPAAKRALLARLQALEPAHVAGLTPRLMEKQDEFVESAAPEVMLSGAFGAGKTYALCRKVVRCALRHPGNQVGLFRSTLKALKATTLRTLLRGDGDLPPALPPYLVVQHNKSDQIIKLSNGSEIVYGGLRSGEKDLTWFTSLNLGDAGVDQAEELTFEEWDVLLGGRLRLNLAGKEHRQLFGACNPRHPGHWIYQHFFVRRPPQTHVIKTKTFDNPHLPADYLARVKRFTGVFYRRFVLGEWVGAEGLVYDNFDPTLHVIERFALRPAWRRYRSIDFGFTSPFVCLWFAQLPADNPAGLPEGSFVLYREIYMTGRRVTVHGAQINDLSAGERFRATFADHDAAGRAELDALGIPTTAADKEIVTGLQTVRLWLGNEPVDPAQPDGERTPPRLYFFGDALVERDASLALDPKTGQEKHAPVCTVDEFGFYRWPEDRAGHARREVPVDDFNHGMDATRYFLATLAQPEPKSAQRVRVTGLYGKGRRGR